MFTNTFWADVLSAMWMVGITVVLLLIAYLANMLFSLYMNIAVIKEKFNKDKFIRGFVKVIVLSLGLALTTLLLVAIPAFMNYVGIEIPEDFMKAYSITAVVAVFCKSIIKYAIEAVEKAKQIIDNFDPIGEDKNKPSEYDQEGDYTDSEYLPDIVDDAEDVQPLDAENI